MNASTLHLLFTSPASSTCLAECAQLLNPDDQLLLIGDAVYAAIIGSNAAQLLDGLHLKGHALHAIAEDCVARGITEQLLPCIRPVTYADFVAMTVAASRSMSWF
jgi:tRNA 2-thiouridine synthesizing protein B